MVLITLHRTHSILHGTTGDTWIILPVPVQRRERERDFVQFCDCVSSFYPSATLVLSGTERGPIASFLEVDTYLEQRVGFIEVLQHNMYDVSEN